MNFFEEFIQIEPIVKGLGVRIVEDAGARKLGVDGTIEMVLTENLALHRGHRMVTIHASMNRPLRVRTMLQKLEGKKTL